MGFRKSFAFCLTALLLTGLLFSGCGTLLEGPPSLDVRPHQVDSPTLDPGDLTIVDSQAELERVIWNMVQAREESGLLRVLYPQAEGVEIVEAALLEVQRMPLAAYAVSLFQPMFLPERQQGVTEIELLISYQKTAEQMAGVRTVYGPATARRLLEQMLRNGETELAMLSPATIAHVSFLESIIRDYSFSQALDVIIRPEVVINLYPSSGSGAPRIAEVLLDFGFDQEALFQMRDDLHQAAQALISEMPEALTPAQKIIWLAESLSSGYGLTPTDFDRLHDIQDTAYGALAQGIASSEGFSMAFQALLTLLDIDTLVVRGELDGEPHAWNLVHIDGYYYHIDISMLSTVGPELTLFVPDEIMMFQNGYSWDAVLYPRADSLLRFGDFSELA